MGFQGGEGLGRCLFVSAYLVLKDLQVFANLQLFQFVCLKILFYFVDIFGTVLAHLSSQDGLTNRTV